MKKLLAIAIAAGLVAPMAVMADTTLYGKLKVSIGSDDDGKDAVTTVKSHKSRLGIKGTNELDVAGMSATYQVEFDLGKYLDNSGHEFGTTDSNLGTRNAWLGLKGNFGEVRVGRHDTPYDLATGVLDFMNLGGHNGLDDDTRATNAIAYMKGFGPLGFAAAYVPDEKAGSNNDIISSLVNYSSNGIYAGWGYQKVKGADPSNKLGLGYTFPAGHKTSLTYEKSSKGAKNTVVNGRYKFGKAYVQAEISKTKDVDGSLKVFEAGYGLAKSTQVWVSFGKNDKDNLDQSHTRLGVTSGF